MLLFLLEIYFPVDKGVNCDMLVSMTEASKKMGRSTNYYAQMRKRGTFNVKPVYQSEHVLLFDFDDIVNFEKSRQDRNRCAQMDFEGHRCLLDAKHNKNHRFPVLEMENGNERPIYDL